MSFIASSVHCYWLSQVTKSKQNSAKAQKVLLFKCFSNCSQMSRLQTFWRFSFRQQSKIWKKQQHQNIKMSLGYVINYLKMYSRMLTFYCTKKNKYFVIFIICKDLVISFSVSCCWSNTWHIICMAILVSFLFIFFYRIFNLNLGQRPL